jgi:hypothetical protein
VAEIVAQVIGIIPDEIRERGVCHLIIHSDFTPLIFYICECNNFSKKIKNITFGLRSKTSWRNLGWPTRYAVLPQGILISL